MVANSLVGKKQQKQGMTAFLTQDAVKEQINKVVGAKDSQSFITAIVSAVQVNPKLKECSNTSILSSALVGESLKLSPSPQLGQYYIVPYDTKNGKEARFQMGYRGYVQLAIRSGQYKKLNVVAIKEGELVHFNPLTEEIEVNLIEDVEERENAETIGYYAMFEYLNGFRKEIYWSKRKMMLFADTYVPAFSLKATKGKNPKVSYQDYLDGKYDKKDEWLYSSNWYQNFDEMGVKTMLIQLIKKWGVMSADMQTALANDIGAVADGNQQYVDNYVDNVEEPQEQPQEVVADVEVEEVKTNEAENVLFSK